MPAALHAILVVAVPAGRIGAQVVPSVAAIRKAFPADAPDSVRTLPGTLAWTSSGKLRRPWMKGRYLRGELSTLALG